MLIVSQDKDAIVNFNNVMQIFIVKNENEKTYLVRYENVDGYYETLGKYKEEERAKEILKMIVSAYQSYKLFQCINNATQEEIAKKYQEFSITPFRIEMPQE